MKYRVIVEEIEYRCEKISPELFTFARFSIREGFKTVGSIHYYSWDESLIDTNFKDEEQYKTFAQEGKKKLKETEGLDEFEEQFLLDDRYIKWYSKFLADRALKGEGLFNQMNMILSGRKFGIKVTEF